MYTYVSHVRFLGQWIKPYEYGSTIHLIQVYYIVKYNQKEICWGIITMT